MRHVSVPRGHIKRKTDRFDNPVNLPKVPGRIRRCDLVGQRLPWENKVHP